jgi:phosphoglycolate phosphatase
VGDADVLRRLSGRDALTLVFDLDGTLVDSVRDLAASASEMATSFGGRALRDDEVAMMVGDGAAVLVKRALSAAGLDPETPGALARFLEIYDRRLLDTTVAYDGTVDTLLLASRHARLTVLTNKPLVPSRRILDALGLAVFFADVIGGDGPHGRKPDPAGLRALANGDLHVALVGDSPVDRDTAVAAGATFVWARYGFGAERFAQPPDTPYVLERPADLAAVVDRLRATRS